MSNLCDFEKHRDQIENIPAYSIKKPYMPIPVYLQEADNLASRAKDDMEALQAIGLAPYKITELRELANACRYVQSEWIKEDGMRSEAACNWKEMKFQAVELNKKLVSSFRFAFREHEDLKGLLNGLSTTLSNTRLIQQLSDLSTIGMDHTGILSPILDLSLLEKADSLSDELATALAIVNGERRSGNKTRLIRDKAYSLLKKTVDEVRNCGKFAFRNNAEHLAGYKSFWVSKHNRNRSVIDENTPF